MQPLKNLVIDFISESSFRFTAKLEVQCPHIHRALPTDTLPPYSKHPEWYICCDTFICHKRWIKNDTSSSPRVHSFCWGSLVHFMGLDKHMTRTHHFCVIQNSFTALKIPCARSVYCPSLQPLATTIFLLSCLFQNVMWLEYILFNLCRLAYFP